MFSFLNHTMLKLVECSFMSFNHTMCNCFPLNEKRAQARSRKMSFNHTMLKLVVMTLNLFIFFFSFFFKTGCKSPTDYKSFQIFSNFFLKTILQQNEVNIILTNLPMNTRLAFLLKCFIVIPNTIMSELARGEYSEAELTIVALPAAEML